MIIDPYSTSFGSMINKKPIIEGLIKYLVTSDINLNYEYSNADDCRLVFITGVNDDEKDLPLWEHPILFEDHKGKNVVAVDMRKYVKLVPDFTNLQTIVKDKGGFDYMLLRSLVMADMASDVYGSFIVIEKNIALAFSYWLSDSISSVTLLNPLEKSILEVIIVHYANMLMVNGDVDSSIVETSKVKISKSKTSIPMNVKQVGDIVDKLKHDVSTIDDLVDNIKAGLDSPKTDMIDTNTLINMVSSSWFGPGGSESVMMGIENMPTWIAMLYSSSSNKSYKRSRLATILEKHTRKIDLKELNKIMDLYIKDRTF
jgi:hypothetical protein